MTPEQMWWYTDQLKRKTASYESDLERVDALLRRPDIVRDAQATNRLKRERDDIKIHLNKLKRGLLY